MGDFCKPAKLRFFVFILRFSVSLLYGISSRQSIRFFVF
nr:MAG TPA: hypothetical protein [Caudoviricetes sp.]